ncbi:MAG: glutamate racemase [Hydrogenothermaceae bacterium]|nr:glutamate racemase [Hydrogenothermaceae bacterium]
MPIGIFDSGIGGLTVFKSIAEAFRNIDIYYLGDTARVPYGNKSKETIIRYSAECGTFLYHNYKIDALVIACNTASSYAYDVLKRILPIPVVGVVLPGALSAVRVTKNKKVGVIGTTATVRSNSYLQAIKTFNEGVEVYQKACPLLVPLVEEGWIEGTITEAIIKRYLDEVIEKGIDTLILGCTHYPVLRPVIKKIYPQLNVVDSSDGIVEYINSLGINTEENAVRHILITDESPSFQTLKDLLIGDVKTEKIELSDLCSL